MTEKDFDVQGFARDINQLLILSTLRSEAKHGYQIALDVETDSNGRVLLPKELREFAGLDRHAILIGQGNKFELWNEARWNERRDQWLNDETTGEEGLPHELETLSL